jgi:hypothetical protein
VDFKEYFKRSKTLSLVEGSGCKKPNPRWLPGYVKYWVTRKRRGSIILYCAYSIVEHNIQGVDFERIIEEVGDSLVSIQDIMSKTTPL